MLDLALFISNAHAKSLTKEIITSVRDVSTWKTVALVNEQDDTQILSACIIRTHVNENNKDGLEVPVVELRYLAFATEESLTNLIEDLR